MCLNEMPDNKQQILEQVVFLKNNIGYVPVLEGLVDHGFSWGKEAGNMSFSYGDKNEIIDRINIFGK